MQSVSEEAFVFEAMEVFARDTGLSPRRPQPRRYLWTDAFAVCNFLELYRCTRDEKYRQLALDLVAQVHETLGKHREDDLRSGWISGLDEEEGHRHPTAGGLRIGKKLPESTKDESYDDRLEWDSDGQYYHYLTKWMHALHQVSKVTDDPSFNRWACELAKAAHEAFVYEQRRGKAKRMYWKMSIDLTYPVVASMGQHDPLDGFVTLAQLQRLSRRQSCAEPQLELTGEMTDLAQLCQNMNWTTDDPLGIGGILFDAYRIMQLSTGDDGFDDQGMLPLLLEASIEGTAMFLASHTLDKSVEHRFAFRELGLSIGLHAIPPMLASANTNKRYAVGSTVHSLLEKLSGAVSLADHIERYWLKPSKRQSEVWRAHEDINVVMLATSLAPAGFSTL